MVQLGFRFRLLSLGRIETRPYVTFQVERILIPYARTAKKMDMRKLKAAMWGILADRGNDDKVCVPPYLAHSASGWHTRDLNENLLGQLVAFKEDKSETLFSIDLSAHLTRLILLFLRFIASYVFQIELAMLQW